MTQGLQLSQFRETQTRPSQIFPPSPVFPPPTAQLPALPSSSRDAPLSPLYGTPSRSFTKMVQFPNLQNKSSEASRLRAPNYEYQRPSTDGRHTPEIHETATEFFSRARQTSLGGKRKEIDLNKSLPPTHTIRNEENSPYFLPQSRNRGVSGSSSHSALHISASTRRLSPPKPDYRTPETPHGKQLTSNNISYRPSRRFSNSEYNQMSNSNYDIRNDPIPSRSGIESEEIRSSFRSAVTTNSSYLDANGTERSSLVTKRSSRTSIFVRDEGMSVDDAIEMYEKGFTDTSIDGDCEVRPHTESSAKMEMLGSGAPMDEWSVKPSSKPAMQPVTLNAGISLAVDQENLAHEASPSRPVTKSATAQFDDTRDRYGFKKKTPYVTFEEYEAWNQSYMAYLTRRKRKWVALMRQHNLPTISPQTFPPKSDKVKRFVRKGIPPSWRGAAWFHYAGGPAMLARNPGVYDHLVRRAFAGDVTETDDEIIERDLNRTFPDNIKFKPDADPLSPSNDEPIETPILKSLRCVLRAFSIYHPKIGYCQSLNFLAGLLLLFMPEENAFWMLNIITRIFLPGTHSLTLEGANVDLGVLMSSVKEMMPSIWAKIGNELDGRPTSPSANSSMRLPPITLCTTAWFMSCFIGTLPIESTLRVWDSFFYEGSKTLFRIALTIFKLGEPQIRAVNDPMEIFQVVQGIPRGMMDCNRLMEACFKRRGGFIKLTQDEIERGRAERRRGYAEERERLAAGASVAPASGTVRTKGTTRKGGTFLGRPKKERVRRPVQV